MVGARNYKLNRLFLFFADRHNHVSFQRLDRSRIDLGKGKRALVDRRRYDSKYQITVPDFLLKETDVR